jgi:hypothetical protein
MNQAMQRKAKGANIVPLFVAGKAPALFDIFYLFQTLQSLVYRAIHHCRAARFGRP